MAQFKSYDEFIRRIHNDAAVYYWHYSTLSNNALAFLMKRWKTLFTTVKQFVTLLGLIYRVRQRAVSTNCQYHQYHGWQSCLRLFWLPIA